MIVNIDWLTDFVDFDLSPEEMADLLTNAGLESEAPLDRKVLEIDLTPNRPDCMSHRGVAREIATLTEESLRSPEIRLEEADNDPIEDHISVEIQDVRKCPRYACRVVRNVRIKPSPSWMVERLASVGIRTINNVVDVSNYVLMELGHPLHTFDLARIRRNRIVVRAASEGEIFVTLDGIQHELNSHHLLICDGVEGIALAGIMGGENSEISESTKDVLIESAYFDPVTIRRGSKAVGLTTESSRRFERGTDYEGLMIALDRSAQLLAELAEGTVCKGIVDVYPNPKKRKVIKLRPPRASMIAGVDFSDEFIINTLSSLEIQCRKNEDSFTCISPTFRPDLDREIDLIEELARIYGYARIPSQATYCGLLDQSIPDPKSHVATLKRILSGFGFHEVYSNSLVNRGEAFLFSEEKSVTIQNPQSIEMSTMRTSLFPGLLSAVEYNMNRGNRNLRLFEYGMTFAADELENLGIREREELSGVICGEHRPKQWKEKAAEVDFYVIKGYMRALASSLRLTAFSFRETKKSVFDGGQELSTSDSRVVATFGLLSPAATQRYGIDEPVYGFALALPVVEEILSRSVTFREISPFPGISRDLAFVADKSITVNEFVTIIKEHSRNLLESVYLFDVYQDEQIGNDKRSLTFNLFFLNKKRTLKDDEVDDIVNEIISEISEKLNAKLR